ncbi:TPA: SEC10/PgrA surface exclusion domain-containing protein [Streptococcus suis]
MTKKKQLTGLVLATGLAVFGSEVQADEIVTATSPAEAEAVSSTTSSQPVTAQDVADAQAVVDEASQVAQAIDTAVATTEQALSEEQATNQDLKDSLAKAEAITDETLTTAQSAITSAQAEVEEAQIVVTESQSEKTSIEQKVNEQTDNVTSATAEVATAEATVKALEDKISSLENNNTSDIPTLEAEIQSKEGLVEEGKAKVAQAEVALETARKATTDKEKAVEEQKTAVANAEIVVDSAAKTYSDALTAKEGTEKALNDAKSALDTAKEGTVVTETIQTGETTSTVGGKATLNPDVAYSTWYEHNGVLTNSKYLTAIKNLANGSGTVEDVKNAIKSGFFGMETDSLDDLNAIASPNGMAFESWTEVSEFSFKDTDYTTLVDVRNLTEEQRTELAQFYVALVNDLRSKVGTEPLVVTADSVKVADDTVTSIFNKVFPHYTGMSQEEMSADGFWNTMDGLNLETGQSGDTPLKLGSSPLSVTNAVAQSTNGNLVLGWETGNAAQYPNNDGRKQSMATLKSNLLAVLGVQLYGTSGDGFMSEANGGLNGTRSSNFDTALAVLGLDNDNSYNSVGVDFEHLGTFNGFVDRAPKTFVVFSKSTDSAIANPYETVTGGSTTTTPVYETVSRTVVDEEKVAQAQKAYDDARIADTEAQRVVDEAKTAYETAQQSYGEAQTQLNNLIAGTVDIKSLEDDLNTAVAELQENEVSLKSSKELLALAQSSKTEKDEALKVAQEDLKNAKVVLDEKKEILKAEEEKLSTLKAELARKETSYKAALTRLTEAHTNLKTAQEELARLKSLVSKKSSLAEALAISEAKIVELEKLLKEQKVSQANAKETLTQAQKNYALLKAEYDYLMELERLSVDNTVTVLEDGTVIAVPKDAPTAPVLPSISLEDWLKTKEAEIVSGGQLAVPLVNQAGQVIGYEAQVVAKPQAPVVSSTSSQTAQGKASLPNTGQASNLLFFVGLGTLGLAVGVRRKGE